MLCLGWPLNQPPNPKTPQHQINRSHRQHPQTGRSHHRKYSGNQEHTDLAEAAHAQHHAAQRRAAPTSPQIGHTEHCHKKRQQGCVKHRCGRQPYQLARPGLRQQNDERCTPVERRAENQTGSYNALGHRRRSQLSADLNGAGISRQPSTAGGLAWAGGIENSLLGLGAGTSAASTNCGYATAPVWRRSVLQRLVEQADSVVATTASNRIFIMATGFVISIRQFSRQRGLPRWRVRNHRRAALPAAPTADATSGRCDPSAARPI